MVSNCKIIFFILIRSNLITVKSRNRKKTNTELQEKSGLNHKRNRNTYAQAFLEQEQTKYRFTNASKIEQRTSNR